MGERKDITVPLPKSLYNRVTDTLDYGDTLSAWVRNAIRIRLLVEHLTDDRDGRIENCFEKATVIWDEDSPDEE